MTWLLIAVVVLIAASLLIILAAAGLVAGVAGTVAKMKTRAFFVDVDRSLEQVLYQPWDRDDPEYSEVDADGKSPEEPTMVE